MNTNQILTKEGLPPKIDAYKTLYSLKTRIRNWHKTSMLNVRKTMVFSAGIANADIMIIGEAPGYNEERLEEPFVGQAGRKLDGILKAMGVDRKNVYTTNILKYRPSMPDQTTNTRQPTESELRSFLPFIHEEIEAVSPKMIIALGNTTAQALLNNKKSMRSNRGVFHFCHGFPLCVTHDPLFLIHNDLLTVKRMVWEDMVSVMDFLKMPVSEKQRAFFT